MNSWALASLAAMNISSSEASKPYLMFSRNDRAKSTHSWLTTAICERAPWRGDASSCTSVRASSQLEVRFDITHKIFLDLGCEMHTCQYQLYALKMCLDKLPCCGGTGLCNLSVFFRPAGCSLTAAGKISPAAWHTWTSRNCSSRRSPLFYLASARRTRPSRSEGMGELTRTATPLKNINHTCTRCNRAYLEHQIVCVFLGGVRERHVFKFNVSPQILWLQVSVWWYFGFAIHIFKGLLCCTNGLPHRWVMMHDSLKKHKASVLWNQPWTRESTTCNKEEPGCRFFHVIMSRDSRQQRRRTAARTGRRTPGPHCWRPLCSPESLHSTESPPSGPRMPSSRAWKQNFYTLAEVCRVLLKRTGWIQLSWRDQGFLFNKLVLQK